MPTRWITVRHERTGAESSIPASSADAYARRGWLPVTDQPDTPDEVVEPDQDAAPAESPRRRKKEQ